MRFLPFAVLLCGLPVAVIAADIAQPAKIPKGEAAGTIFKRPGVVVKKDTRDVITMMSTDRKFESGMYKAGPSHHDFKDKDYGVDEFMLFVTGSVTLTSADGTVTTLGPGDAVTVPAEWRGTWDTPGYTKYYVIYSRAGKLD